MKKTAYKILIYFTLIFLCLISIVKIDTGVDLKQEQAFEPLSEKKAFLEQPTNKTIDGIDFPLG